MCISSSFWGWKGVRQCTQTPLTGNMDDGVSQGSNVKGTAQIVPHSRPLGDIVSNTVFTCISDYLVWLSMVWDEWTHRGLVCGLPGSLSPTIIVQCHFLGIFFGFFNVHYKTRNKTTNKDMKFGESGCGELFLCGVGSW